MTASRVMSVEQYTIVVSLPHKALSPNGRAHWRTRHGHAKRAKAEAYLRAMEASKCKRPMWETATVQATFYLPNRRGLNADQDNRIASLKASIDGIALAGIIANDRGVTWLPIRHEVDADNPRLQIVITKGDRA